MSQISLSSAAVPWEVGQTFTYEVSIEQTSIVVENKVDGLTSSASVLKEFTDDYVITAIDKIDLDVTFDTLEYDGTVGNITQNYNSTNFGLAMGDFTATYLQFENNNTFYLRHFYYPDSVPILVDPDFADINDNFKDGLNESKIIDSYIDWDDLKYYDFTLGNLLNNMTSWSINVGTTLSDARTAITDETKEYTMEFDLSGLLTFRYTKVEGAEVITIYDTYDVATISLNWEYDSDGILKSYTENQVLSYERNDATFTIDSTNKIKQPGFSLDTNALPGFELYLSILGLIFVPIIYKRRK